MPLPSYSLVTAPDAPPVTLDQAKEHLRIEHAAAEADIEDDYITRLVDAARVYVESGWGLALINQSHKVLLDAWPAGGIKLRPFPVASVTHLKVWNGSAFAASSLSTQLVEGRPALLILADGGSPPVPARTRQGIEVEFVCGFGADGDDVPASIKQAILLLVGHWYENREASVSSKTGFGVSADLTRGVEDLMAAYRSPRLA